MSDNTKPTAGQEQIKKQKSGGPAGGAEQELIDAELQVPSIEDVEDEAEQLLYEINQEVMNQQCGCGGYWEYKSWKMDKGKSSDAPHSR